MDKQSALKLWDLEMNKKEYAYDFSGRKIKRSDYGEKNQVGWNIAYMKPLELGGKDDVGNMIIMHHTTIEEKGLSYPEFEIMNRTYKVIYEESEDFYYIEKTSNDDGGFI